MIKTHDEYIAAMGTLCSSSDTAEFLRAAAALFLFGRSHKIPEWLAQEIAKRIEGGPSQPQRGAKKTDVRASALRIAAEAISQRRSRAEACKILSLEKAKTMNAAGVMLDDVMENDIPRYWPALIDFDTATWAELEHGLRAFYPRSPEKAVSILEAAKALARGEGEEKQSNR